MDSGFQGQDLSLELGFGTPIITGNPDSLSCMPDPKARDSGFHKQKVSGFPYIGRTEWIKKKYSQLNIRCIERVSAYYGVCLIHCTV